MMWNANNDSIQMTEGDFGIALPITVTGITLGASDSIRITIKHGEITVITKTFTDIQQNTIQLELTQAESNLLPVGSYLYSLDWYQDGVFMCNIVPSALFVVGDKA